MNRSMLRYGLIILLFCLGALALAGCGAAESSASPPAAAPELLPTGIYVDATAEQWLRDRFEAVASCAGMEGGDYDDLTVVIMPPLFPCPYYKDGCSGEYVPPSTIKIGALGVWPHEVVHYLLWRNTGKADAYHQSEIFQRCG